jgi:tetratricopeptide (TPR) repeat protein
MDLVSETRQSKCENENRNIELILYVSKPSNITEQRIENFKKYFNSITIAAPFEKKLLLSDNMRWFRFTADMTKSAVWNRLIQESKSQSQFIIDEDEELTDEACDFLRSDDQRKWAAALISVKHGENVTAYHQIRLIREAKGDIFKGGAIPDATEYILQNEILLDDSPILMSRSSSPFSKIDLLKGQELTSRRDLVEGYEKIFNKKYSEAAAYFRKVLKHEKLLPFDRLAAVNGLSTCLTEQFKWDRALKLAEQSAEAEPIQYIPYLIQFRIYELKKDWDQAYSALEKYYNNIDKLTRAGFDKGMSREATLGKMGDLALKIKDHRLAGGHFEELYNIKEGAVDRGFLKRLFVMASERGDFTKSKVFFEKLFVDYLPDKLSRRATVELQDCMEQFMKNGWYDYALDVYEDLVEEHPSNGEYKRRYVVLLTKLNRMERAKKLIAAGI